MRLSVINTLLVLFSVSHCTGFDETLISNNNTCIERLREKNSFPIAENTGDGTPADPYFICTEEQFLAFAEETSLWDKSFILKDDLDLTGREITDNADLVNGHFFEGSLDGDFHTVSGVNIVREKKYVAIFPLLINATVKNITLKNWSVESTSTASDSATALLSGFSSGGTYQNVKVNNSVVKAIDSAGLLTGFAKSNNLFSNIQAEDNSVTASGADGSAGGLIYSADGAVYIFDSLIKGNVKSKGRSGGLATFLKSGAVKNTEINSTVVVEDYTTGNTYAGGVSASVSDVLITEVSVKGSIEGIENIGGVAGKLNGPSTAQIQYTGVNATVKGNKNVGGIAGLHQGGSITATSVQGTVTASTSHAGGIAGRVKDTADYTSEITNNIVYAGINSPDYSGGGAGEFIAANGSNKISQLIIIGAVQGTTNTGALIGKTTTSGSESITIGSSFWLQSANSGLNDVGSTDETNVESKTEFELKTESTYSSWSNKILFWNFSDNSYPGIKSLGADF